jgi:hypothetical protein
MLNLTRHEIRSYWEHRHPDQRIAAADKASVRCVLHNENNASCTLFLGNKGGFKCHGCGRMGSLIRFEMFFSDCDLQRAEANISEITGAKLTAGRTGKSKREAPTAQYDYRDENRKLLYQKCRYESKETGKRFLMFHPVDGGMASGIDPKNGERTRRVLYNLPDVIAADRVCVCEGEKDCDNVVKAELWSASRLKIAATTSYDASWKPNQTPKWRESYDAHFKDKDVVIFADNDASGCTYAEFIAASIAPYAAGVKIVRFPELPEKADVSDFLEAHTPAELEARVASTPAWKSAVQKLDRKQSVEPLGPKNGFSLQSIGDLLQQPEKPTDYLIDGLLVRGTLSCLIAKPKVERAQWREHWPSRLQLVAISSDAPRSRER